MILNMNHLQPKDLQEFADKHPLAAVWLVARQNQNELKYLLHLKSLNQISETQLKRLEEMTGILKNNS